MARNESAKPQAEKEAAKQIHEQTDLRLLVVVVFLVIIVVSAFVIHGALWWWIDALPGYAKPATDAPWQVIAPHVPPPAQNFPALQLNPQRDLQQYLQQQQRQLHSYGWVAPGSNIIHIPIERAMEIIVQQGLPQWPAATK